MMNDPRKSLEGNLADAKSPNIAALSTHPSTVNFNVEPEDLTKSKAPSEPDPEPEMQLHDEGDCEETGEDGEYYENDEEIESPPCGILDDYIVSKGLSNLKRTADGTQHTYLKLVTAGLEITDISVLTGYIHLQTVELPYNDISDLEALGNMPHLLHLDLSHNKITKLLDFTPPKNLKTVNLSYNLIETMIDLSAHHYLQELILDNNQIDHVTGINNCKRLTHLSIAHNNLTSITGLRNLPIRHIDFSGNSITKITNIDTLNLLQSINLSGNKIRSMRGLEGHCFLEFIDMKDNEVIDLSEIQFVSKLPLIRQLNLEHNPVCQLPDYRHAVLFNIQMLTDLDCKKVDVQEKVAASNMFQPPMEVIASRDHIMHIVYSFLQPSRVLESTLASEDTPYPMLILVGPHGSGKKDLAMKLVEEFPEYFGFVVSHTTRKMRPTEENGKDYHFVNMEKFEDDVKLGKFFQTTSLYGNLYGVTIESVEAIARDGLACVMHMELEGVLTLKKTYLEPRYVFVMPLSREAHSERLRTYDSTEQHIEWTLKRAAKYAEYNREHPGFFDMFINSDCITDSYHRLRRLIMDYLGMNIQSTPASEHSQTGSQSLAKEATNDTLWSTGLSATGIGMGPRSTSKPSIGEEQSEPLHVIGNILSPVPHAGRGIVEEESLRRRTGAAQEVVSGTRPSLYEQILQKLESYVPGAPRTNFGDSTSWLRSRSAPIYCITDMDTLPMSSPDSSNLDSDESSGLINISEARAMEGVKQSVSYQTQMNDLVDIEADNGTVNETTQNIPRKESQYGRSISMPPYPVSSPDTSSESLSSSRRPGSCRHPVLPPIEQHGYSMPV